MKFLSLCIFNLLFSSLVDDYYYIGVSNDNLLYDIQSNSVYEMAALNDTLWLRTGLGLSFVLNNSYSDSNSFFSINNNNLPLGGSPAFIINEDLISSANVSSKFHDFSLKTLTIKSKTSE